MAIGHGGGKGFDVVGQLGALRRYARALTRDEAAAEDLVHDALVHAYEGRRSFRPEGDLRSWLLAILHNTFVGGRRSRQAELIRIDRAAGLATPATAGHAQEASVRLGQIHRAFAALPDEQRAALHLVAIEGLSYQEAAATLAVPLGTLMSRLGRARAALRDFERTGPPPRPETSRPDRGCDPDAESTGRARLRLVGGSHGDD